MTMTASSPSLPSPPCLSAEERRDSSLALCPASPSSRSDLPVDEVQELIPEGIQVSFDTESEYEDGSEVDAAESESEPASRSSCYSSRTATGAVSSVSSYPTTPTSSHFAPERSSFIRIHSPFAATSSSSSRRSSEREAYPEATPRATRRTAHKRTSAPDVLQAAESWMALRRVASVGDGVARRRSGIDIPRSSHETDRSDWREREPLVKTRRSASMSAGSSSRGRRPGHGHTHDQSSIHTHGRPICPSGPNSPTFTFTTDTHTNLDLDHPRLPLPPSPSLPHPSDAVSRDRRILSGFSTTTSSHLYLPPSPIIPDHHSQSSQGETQTSSAAVPEQGDHVSPLAAHALKSPFVEPPLPLLSPRPDISPLEHSFPDVPHCTAEPLTPSPNGSAESLLLTTPHDHHPLSKGTSFAASFPTPPPREPSTSTSPRPSLPSSASPIALLSSPLPKPQTSDTVEPMEPGIWAHPRHDKAPSLPSSTRTASSAPIDTPLTSGFSHSGSRRLSKFTAFSGSSSASSLYSSDTDSLRDPRHHRITEHPDVSTVFEETSFDLDRKDYRDRDRGHHQPPHGSLNRPHRSSDNNNNNNHSQRTHTRAGTVSSINSGRSNKSVHPFASNIHRAPSPPSSLPTVNAPLGSASGSSSLTTPSSSRSYSSISGAARMHLAPAHQVTLAEEGDGEDEEKCPICVESLSFTYRLPGEKPHVVPECGHALHEASCLVFFYSTRVSADPQECFVTVYGEVPTHGSKRNIGLCGVCRQKIRIVDGGGERKRSKGKSESIIRPVLTSELEMMMGGPSAGPAPPSLRASPSYPSLNSFQTPSVAADPNGDDPVGSVPSSSSSRSLLADSQTKVVVPSITIRAEFPSTTRRQSKPITAMISIEVPHAGDRGQYPAARLLEPVGSPSIPRGSPHLPSSPGSSASIRDMMAAGPAPGPTPSAFAQVEAELKHRVIDYKNSGLDNLGSLRLYDMIAIRKGSMLREFLMYLYNDALICISEEKPSAFQKIFSSGSSMRSNDTRSSAGTGAGRGPLKLRGRIYVKHVKKLVDSSMPNELSITILMENEGMESFILTFKDKASHETWRSTLQQIVDDAKNPSAVKGGNSANKIAKLMGSGAPSPAPRSAKSATTPGLPSSTSMGFGPIMSDFSPSSPSHSARGPSAGDLVQNAPLAPVHTPLDLVIVLSIPSSQPGTPPPLKVRLMRQSLAFVLALMGSKDRVSIVACELGTSIRKTPLLNPTKYESRRKLEEFIEGIGAGPSPDDEFEVQTQPDERHDIITGMNVSLDVILQRKAKNPLTGLILISDTTEVTKRAQMDLVCARLDAANIPVHSLGYGKTHDPTPLWMVSNHTQGTYTFVREWYHLRDSLAGVIGGLMTVALTNMKLHLSAQENEFRIVKVTGTPQAIGSATGRTLDIELKELRFGERREILVELEMIGDGSARNSSDSSGEGGRPGPGSSYRKSPSSQGGLDNLSIADSNSVLRDMVYEEGMVDEVPVIEVDCSFHDPAVGRSVSRLAHPVLLTLAVLPSTSSNPNQSSDPTVQRRKMELIASDMLTRSLLLVSRRNFGQAHKLLSETRRIVRTISDGIRSNSPSPSQARTKKELASVHAVAQLDNIVADMDGLCEALDENPELFAKDQRNFASQQGIILRAQRSWTVKTGTEAWYCTEEVRRVIQISGDWGVKGQGQGFGKGSTSQ